MYFCRMESVRRFHPSPDYVRWKVLDTSISFFLDHVYIVRWKVVDTSITFFLTMYILYDGRVIDTPVTFFEPCMYGTIVKW